MTQTTIEKLEVIVKAADDRLAQDIMAMEVSNLTPLADYFVVMHANNEKQVSAIVDSIIDAADEAGIKIKNIEGKAGGKWILMDLYDIIVHVFYHSERSHYNIEKVWRDAPLVDVSGWIVEQ